MRSLTTPDGPMGAIVAEPASSPRGGIVVLQEAFGLTDHIGNICTRLAADGWLAVAPALYHRTGSPVLAYGDFDAVAPHFMALTPEGLAMDVAAAIGVLDEAGVAPTSRGVVGFCAGGAIALWAATVFDLGAAVTFYGGGVVNGRFGLEPLVELAPALRAPWQGHYGDLDGGIPVEQVEALRAATGVAPVETELHRYATAGHGFNCDDRDAYDEPSATLAWSRTLSWFAAHLDHAYPGSTS
ncbi:MAG: dienelactone hydrolase family protein [Acidimicrobiales bacterium]